MVNRPRWPLALRLFYLLYYAGLGCLLPYINLHFERLGIAPRAIGLLAAISPAAMLTVAPLWGALADRLGDSRLLLRILPFGVVGAILLLSIQTAPGWIAGSVLLLAICNSPLTPLADALAMGWAKEERSLAYGRLRLHGSLGWTVGVFGMGQVVDYLGLEATFPGAALLVGLTTLTTFGFRLPPQSIGREASQPRKALLRNSTLVMLLASSMVLSLAMQANQSFFPLYMDTLGAQPGIIGLTIALSSLSELPFMLAAGPAIRRLGTQRVLLIGFGLFAIQWLIYALVPSYWWLMPAQVLVGLSFALWWVASVQRVNELAPPGRTAAAQGLLTSVNYGLAALIGSAAGGYAFDYLGPRWLYILGCAIVLGALGLLGFTGRSQHT